MEHGPEGTTAQWHPKSTSSSHVTSPHEGACRSHERKEAGGAGFGEPGIFQGSGLSGKRSGIFCPLSGFTLAAEQPLSCRRCVPSCRGPTSLSPVSHSRGSEHPLSFLLEGITQRQGLRARGLYVMMDVV